ncbi:MAG: hypothetical protein JST10_12420 [Bacteroidetes bacterium]|nr:hypothetical protein [Bacteroidota bacterium]MBS1633366.1 hypothetical protein [Bacteroidota bacterium]
MRRNNVLRIIVLTFFISGCYFLLKTPVNSKGNMNCPGYNTTCAKPMKQQNNPGRESLIWENIPLHFFS